MLEMNNKQIIKEMGKVYQDIFKILSKSKLKRSEIVHTLECAKLDVIFNGGCLEIDGREGVIRNKRKNK